MTRYSPHHEHPTPTGQDTTAPEAQTSEPSSPILLPTPNANLATKGGSQHPDKRRAGNHQPSIKDVAEHLLAPKERNVDPAETGPREDLQGVREALHSPPLREPSGGSDAVPFPGALQPIVCEQEGEGNSLSASMASTPIPEGGLRALRDDRATACASQGSELGERRPSQPANAMCELPSKAALGGGSGAEDEGPTSPTAGMHDLRDDVPPEASQDSDMLTRMQVATSEHEGEGSRTNWGPYAPAIARWESILGRKAPTPTELNAKGHHRLSPRFTEFLMGVPEGWITDIPISRNEQLKAAGNGVVPQQAAAALKDMLRSFDAHP